MKKLALIMGIGCTAAMLFAATEIEGKAPQTRTKVAVFTTNFDHLRPGGLPEGWKVETTNGHGKIAAWSVTADDSAPSAPNVLKARPGVGIRGSMFNLCWTQSRSFKDLDLDLRLRGDSGSEDQGGGPAWRVLDKDNYYVARYNPLENNFRLYVVRNGNRRMLKSASGIKIGAGEWFMISISHHGDHIECSLNGKKLLETDDSTLKEGGGVGLWTKADAATSFDDLQATPSFDDLQVIPERLHPSGQGK